MFKENRKKIMVVILSISFLGAGYLPVIAKSHDNHGQMVREIARNNDHQGNHGEEARGVATDNHGHLDETPENHAPMADDQSVSLAENTSVEITLTGSDPEGDTLIFSVVSGPSHGIITGVLPVVAYTPSLDFSGEDSFTFIVNDGSLDSAEATVSIDVTP